MCGQTDRQTDRQTDGQTDRGSSIKYYYLLLSYYLYYLLVLLRRENALMLDQQMQIENGYQMAISDSRFYKKKENLKNNRHILSSKSSNKILRFQNRNASEGELADNYVFKKISLYLENHPVLPF